MRVEAAALLGAVALAGCALLLLARPSVATYEYARSVGKRCSTCHDSKRPHATNLNAAGRYFMANGVLPGASGPGAGEPGAIGRPRPATGEAIFAGSCAICHGANGEGTPRGRALRGDKVRARTTTEIAAVVRKGVKGTSMFPYEDLLTEEEIQAVARHVAALKRR